MQQKERLLKTLKGEPVDRPPVICPGGMMSMVATGLMEMSGSFWPLAHADPELLERQLTSFQGACNPQCEDVQIAVHLP